MKNHECRQLLERLAAEKLLSLPALRQRGGTGPRQPDVSEPCSEPAPIEGMASDCEPLQLMLVGGRAAAAQFAIGCK